MTDVCSAPKFVTYSIFSGTRSSSTPFGPVSIRLQFLDPGSPAPGESLARMSVTPKGSNEDEITRKDGKILSQPLRQRFNKLENVENLLP